MERTDRSSRVRRLPDPATTVHIRPQDVLYLQPERIQKELPATSRLGRNLNALLKISRVVHSISDLDQLQAADPGTDF